MLLQRQAIRDGGEVDGRWPPEGFTLATLSNWQATTAPGNWWGRYRVDPLPTTSQGEGRLPGLGLYFYDRQSTYIANRPTLNGYGEAIWAALLAAGVDCIGFAQQVFDYSEDPYTWVSLELNGAGRVYPMMRDDAVARGQTMYSELILSKVTNGFQDYTNLKYVKPGDILYYLETGGVDGAHIAVVQKVQPGPDGTITAAGIHLIESYFEGTVANVAVGNVNGRTLSSVQNRIWRIVRLNTQETN
jgi:hypothetical protein